MRSYIILLATLTFGVLALFETSVAFAQSQDCFTFRSGNTWTRVCKDSDDWAQGGGFNVFEWDCRAGSLDGCNFCGACHTPPKSGTRLPYTALEHVTKFKHVLRAGERLRWSDGTTLVNVNGRLCIMGDTKTLHCFQVDSFLAKNPKGDIVGILTPGTAPRPSTAPIVAPTITPKPPG